MKSSAIEKLAAKVLALSLALFLLFPSTTQAKSLLSTPVTTAVTAALSTKQQVTNGTFNDAALIQGNFVYGSGGTTVDAWVQTSVDNATWTDVCNFHFTTASARFLFNVSSVTPVTTEYVPTDGTLTANTSKDGIVGPWWRVKYTTVGTYVGSTLSIDIGGQAMHP